jgi:hypothetical protein
MRVSAAAVSTIWVPRPRTLQMSGGPLSKHCRLLLVAADGEDDLHSFYVWHHSSVNVPQLYRTHLPRLALDCATTSQTARQATHRKATGAC